MREFQGVGEESLQFYFCLAGIGYRVSAVASMDSQVGRYRHLGSMFTRILRHAVLLCEPGPI